MIEVNTLSYSKIWFWITHGTVSFYKQIFAICAFTTTTGYAGFVELALRCEGTPPGVVNIGYTYPFR
jgi:hypothetical protein